MSEQEELEGLDITEHGAEAYPGDMGAGCLTDEELATQPAGAREPQTARRAS